MDQSHDRLVESNAGADEDHQHDEVTCPPLRLRASHPERNTERYRSQRVAEIVNEVGEQRDTTAHDEDRHLHSRRDREHGKADQHGTDASPRADYRAINDAVRVAVTMSVTTHMLVVVRVGGYEGLRPTRSRRVPVLPFVRVAMDMATMSM